MLATLRTASVVGVDASTVHVEVDVSFGLPTFAIVGLPDSSVRESRDRVRSAVRHSGFDFPAHRITVNLAPADTRKTGTSFDLPIALGVLAAAGLMPREVLNDALVVGELSLDGRVQPTHGVLPIALLAARAGTKLVLPAANVNEAALIENVALVPAASLAVVVEALVHGTAPAVPPVRRPLQTPADVSEPPDLADVRGQRLAKRALEIAAAGRHNLLLVGPPGTGKTLLARRMPGILPPPSFPEALETTAIHSVAGVLAASSGLLADRPFRAPHHTVSNIALVGGGRDPRPGEVSLAHNGVLFLDEMLEFTRHALEALREPLEDGTVRIARAARTVQFPARFLLVCAMNPCPCGYANETTRVCRCTPPQIERYRGRLSGPLSDRIDLTVRVAPVPFRALTRAGATELSAVVRERVIAARARQAARYDGDQRSTNADLTGRRLRRHCGLDAASLRLLERAVERMGLSGRAFDRVRRVARTIADLEGAALIQKPHLAEALQYRALD